MESTLFTTLTANEEANLSGGNTPTFDLFLFLSKKSTATNKVTQTANGGNGGAGGKVTIGGGKDSPVVLVKSPIDASGGNGGKGGSNSSNNAVGAG